MENEFQCNLCKGTSFRKIPFRYIFKGRYLDGYKCRTCGLISIFPRPTAEEIEQMYSDDYFTVADNKTHHGDADYMSGIGKTDYSGEINFLRSIVPSGDILEVGCATGSFLNEMKNKGYNVTGIEH